MVVVGEAVVDPGGTWLAVIAQRFRGGDPLTPKQACCLRVALGLIPAEPRVQWDSYVVGRDTGDIWPLAELPEWVLLMVSPMWLQHFLDVFVDIGDRIDDGLAPYPRTMAERVALWIALRQARKVGLALTGSMVYDTLNGLLEKKQHANSDRRWNRSQVKLFDGDFDFLRIWRDDFNHIGIVGDGSTQTDLGAPLLRLFHPYYWWDADIW